MNEPIPDTSTWRCHTCGTEFASYAAAERHAARFRHRRIDWVPAR